MKTCDIFSLINQIEKKGTLIIPSSDTEMITFRIVWDSRPTCFYERKFSKKEIQKSFLIYLEIFIQEANGFISKYTQ